MKYVLLFTCMAIATFGQFLLKKGVTLSTLTISIESIARTLLQPYVLIGFLCYGISSIIWLFVLQKFQLSIAYPALAISYLVVVIGSAFFLQEPLTLSKVAGACSILFGVFLLFRE